MKLRQVDGSFHPNVMIFLVLLVATSSHSNALRMINLDAPERASQGDSIQLSCFYSLDSDKQTASNSSDAFNLTRQTEKTKFKSSSEGANFQSKQTFHAAQGEFDLLYAIKWYKDDSEFFRFLAQDYPKKQILPLEGIQVDLDKSDNQTVLLKNVSLKTSGLFKCEVVTDAPSFITKSIEKQMFIHSLPVEGPHIEVINKQATRDKYGKVVLYNSGDQVELQCSSQESKPAIKLDWIINDTLNLSTIQSNQDNSIETIIKLFSFNNRQFVRLPANLNSNGKSNLLIRNSISNRHNSITTFELVNGSVALLHPRKSASQAATINLSNSLNQILETSTSRLNFTFDSYLFQTLKQYKIQFIGNRRTSRSLGTQQSNLRPRKLYTNLDQTTLDKITNKSSIMQQNKQPHSLTSSINTILESGEDRRPSKVPMTLDRQVLRIRCVARVLHLIMSDEIKLRLVEPRAQKPIPDALETNNRHRNNLNNQKSGALGYIVKDHSYAFVIAVVNAISTFFYLEIEFKLLKNN